MNSILIVEDDITFGIILKNWLEKKGFTVHTVSTTAKAQKRIETEDTLHLILSDLRLPDGDGLQLLQWTQQKGVLIPFIIMTSYADIQSAVQAMKEGAKDYIAKPIQPDELLRKIHEVLSVPPPTASSSAPQENSHIEKISRNIKAKSSSPIQNASPSFLEGISPAAQQLYHYVDLVAPTTMSVLIHGASGTGKEYVAHRIHQLSPRAEKPFIAIDCGAIPKELAASEFFGHIKGAFTGALSDKSGAFVNANGGTLFLDEIGNLDYETQQRLLRALQERKIRPVGSGQEISVDVRIVSATNEDLETALQEGTFREDLYHRVNEFTLQMPALCERTEDIALFADFFLNKANHELGKQVEGFSSDALQALQNYSWPGNLRQMKNLIKRATLLTSGSLITLTELGDELKEDEKKIQNFYPLHDENTERQHIIDTLQRTGNNKSLAARLLGIDRKTLYNKLKLYRIHK